MVKRWVKRIVWIALLLVLSVLPAHFAHVPGVAGEEGRGGGGWVVRGVVIGLVVGGIGLAWAAKRRRGWQ